jgi:hypothetical protein
MTDGPFDVVALERFDQAVAEIQDATVDVQEAACRGDRHCQSGIKSIQEARELLEKAERQLE